MPVDTPPALELSQFRSAHSLRNKIERVLWGLVYLFLYRPSPRPFHFWRRFLLRLFGARVAPGARPHPTTRFWYPRNLTMGENSILGDYVDCYCVDRITLGANAVVSRYSYLCAATHDYKDPAFPLVTAPITIGAGAWVAADVFVGPGVTIGAGAVVGARSSVFRDVAPSAVVAGSPAKQIKTR